MSIPERCVLAAFVITVVLIFWRAGVVARRGLLTELADHGGWLLASDLAQMTGVPEGAVCRLLRALERAGMVKSAPDRDAAVGGSRPTFEYRITSDGLRLLREIGGGRR